MSRSESSDNKVLLLLAGSSSFCSRMRATVERQFPTLWVTECSPMEIWSTILTQKPNVLLFEVGYLHNEAEHKALRATLESIRERCKEEIYIIPAVTRPEKLYYAGDLLFKDDTSLRPSLYIDTFLVTPPATTPSLSSLQEQVIQLVPLIESEFERRHLGETPLPPLGAKGWVQSLAAPESRELWMRWLPKYSLYVEENPLILGATGTGKTNLAYALHYLSGRKGEFISITPRDFSSSELVQAELFGAVAGAYTGAVDKWGLVKAAEKGTLFIDELQSIDRELQGKLITFIENKSYRRVGSAEHTTADVRFVFASNRDLYEMMEEDILRDDFAFRLERILLDLKPLAKRKLDIPTAFAYGLAKIKRQRQLLHPVLGLTPDAYRVLFTHSWPGNLRQLENAAAKMCERAEMNNEGLISHEMAYEVLQNHTQTGATSIEEIISATAKEVSIHSLTKGLHSLDEALGYFKESLRNKALEVSGGNSDEAAHILKDNSELIEQSAITILARKDIELHK